MSKEPPRASENVIVPGETSKSDLREAYHRRDTYAESLDISLKEQENLIAKEM
jgi:hypothetical protein